MGIDPQLPIRPLNVDLSSVAAAADTVFEIGTEEPWILHVEAQSQYDPHLPARTHLYNTLIAYREQKPVLSLVILMRPQADGPAMREVFRRGLSPEDPYLEFQFRTLRLWKLSVEMLLKGGLGVVPLAAVTDDAKQDLPEVIREIERRIAAEAGPEEARRLCTAALLLTGLRFSKVFLKKLWENLAMWSDVLKDSSIYQWMEEEAKREAQEYARRETIEQV